MKKFYFILVGALVLLYSSSCPAQTQTKGGTASISGRVTMEGKGLADVLVIAARQVSFEARGIARSTTDHEGNYLIQGLTPGSFAVFPVGRSYAVAASTSSRSQTSQMVNVAEGESVSGIDFQVMRGGVITGRITDADGYPIIGEEVVVTRIDAQLHPSSAYNSKNRTDDRGVYRVYGLSSGNYRVSLGYAIQDAESSLLMAYGGGGYRKTYYPGVLEETKASILEVREGSEISKIDFSVGRLPTGFAISGRVIDGSGQPAPNTYVVYAKRDPTSQRMMEMIGNPTPTDLNGKFRLEGVQPGPYLVYTLGFGRPGEVNSTYSEFATAEVIDADVTGVELKLRRGATIQGIAVVENSADAAVLASLLTLQLFAHTAPGESSPPSFAPAKMLPDGTFTFSGLAPGKVRIQVQGYPPPTKPLSLVRIEVNGVPQETIDVTDGAQVKGVRLVFNHGAGSLRGRVKTNGGDLPEGTKLWVSIMEPSKSRRFTRYVVVDARGQFLSEDIPQGTYELKLHVVFPSKDLPSIEPITRLLTITDNVETEIVIDVNLPPKKE